MLLDLTILFSDVIGNVAGVDTVADGGNVGVAVFKDVPDNDNEADADADADDDEDDQKDDDDDWDSNEVAATDSVIVVIDEMLSDSRLLSSDAIGDDEIVDTVAGGGNVGAAVFKDVPDNDNEADANEDEDGQKDDDDDWDSNEFETAATDVGMAVVDEEGNGHDGTVPVGGLKYD